MKTAADWLKGLLEKKRDECLACGECCQAFSWHLKASQNDLDRWRRLGREDLLARVNRLNWIWVDPETKERLPVCPYLVRTGPESAHCGIHEIKPDICRAYPTQEQFNTCLRGRVILPHPS